MVLEKMIDELYELSKKAMPRHGSPILGDALLAEARYEDIMAVQEPEKLVEKLLNDFEFLKKEKR